MFTAQAMIPFEKGMTTYVQVTPFGVVVQALPFKTVFFASNSQNNEYEPA
jgi:hypothetical protein